MASTELDGACIVVGDSSVKQFLLESEQPASQFFQCISVQYFVLKLQNDVVTGFKLSWEDHQGNYCVFLERFRLYRISHV